MVFDLLTLHRREDMDGGKVAEVDKPMANFIRHVEMASAINMVKWYRVILVLLGLITGFSTCQQLM
jgi:hypothetical protein